jgi:hypothetical protein
MFGSLGLELCTRATAELWVIARGFVPANRHRTPWHSGIADVTMIYNTATIARQPSLQERYDRIVLACDYNRCLAFSAVSTTRYCRA